MKSAIESNYDLKVIQIFEHGTYKTFRTRRHMGLIVPVSHLDNEELYEMYQMGQHLLNKKERNVAMFILTKHRNLTFEFEKNKYVLLQVPFYVHPLQSQSLGRNLAQFHQNGRSLPVQLTKMNRIGKWKVLWERRVDQMEVFWKGKIGTKILQPFEQMFIESFPYYLGLSENAIQYLVDTELDEEPQLIDSATICHHRFTSKAWSDIQYKIPTEWVFDHAGRDIAEYIRDQFLNHNRSFDAAFVEDYNRTTPLSPFFWRLIYSRLIFPLHYFECIENYYLSPEESREFYEEKLKQILKESSDYEQFLSSLSSFLTMKTRRIYLPKLTWLK